MKTFEQIKETYLSYLESEMDKNKKVLEQLAKENRADEAVFEKIKGNVLDIFTTIFHVNEKKHIKNASETEIKSFCQEYQDSFLRIPKAWKEKYEYAVKNGLTEDKVIEEIKLTTANNLLKTFQTIIQN